MQIILDGRNSNSAQIAANYLQQIVKEYQQELMDGKPKPNNSELVVRNWYNPNLDYKWFVVPSLIAMITTIGVMIVTSLSVAREREQGTLDQLLVSPLTTADFHRQSCARANCGYFSGHHCAGDRHLGLSHSVCRFIGAVLFHNGDLRAVAGWLWSADFVTVRHPAAGVYRGICVYDAGDFTLGLCLTGRKHAGLVAESDVDKPDPPFYGHHETDLPERCESADCLGSLWPLLVIAATTGSAAYAMFRRKVM